MVPEHAGVIELDLNLLHVVQVHGFDCFAAREHVGVIELDLIVFWCVFLLGGE